MHSQLAATPQVAANKTAGKETLYMHPQDANARGIVDEQQVEVFNERGRIYAGVRVTVLTLDIGTSPLTQGPNAMSCLVDVAAA